MRFRTKQTLSIYWQHASKYKWVVFTIVITLVIGIVIDVIIPFFYKRFFDILAQGNVNLAGELKDVILMVLGVYVIAWIFWRIFGYANIFFQARVMSDLHNTCFAYLQGHSYNFFNSSFTGSLVRKVNRFVRSFEAIADLFTWEFGKSVLQILLILIILSYKFPQLAGVALAWTFIYVILNYWFAKYKLKYDIAYADTDSKVGAYLADTVTNNINLKLFGGLKFEIRGFKRITDLLFQRRRYSWILSWYSDAAQAGFMIGLEFIVFYISIDFWKQGLLTIGDFALLQAYLIQIFHQLWDMGKHIRRLYERLADADDMTAILNKEHEVKDHQQAKKMVASAGKIEFRDVTFAYHKTRNIFKNFNLTIQPGEKVALIGPSGGGKSSYIKLLFRFFDIQGGHIFIDDQDIAKVTLESLRQQISLVPQEPILFHRSLYDNISYAHVAATKKEVARASKLAHCHEFIRSFPDQYDTFVGERGVKLSGGERQRVAIARSILKNAPILVLDEATSSLDSESESYIQDALKKLMKGRTTIVIAHRLSTIMQMDRIIVIEKGKITESGTHQELLKVEEGTYQKLWEIQAGGFA